MLLNVIKTSAVAERMIGHVYHLLSKMASPDSEEQTVLARMASEEKNHANVLLEALEHIPAGMEGYDYGAIVDCQTEFMARLVLIQEKLEEESFDWIAVLEELEELENSLADNLLLHLKLILTDEQKSKANKLSADSSNHAKRLRGLIDARR